MKVLLVGDYPPPYGGISIHVQQLAGELGRRGAQVKVMDIGKGGRPVPDVLPGRPLFLLPLRLALRALSGWRVHVHTSGNNPRSWLLVAAVAPMASMVTLHSGLSPTYLSESRWRRRFARLALRPYPRVIAVSRAIGDALVESGVEPRAIRVVSPFLGVSHRRERAPPALLRARARHQPLLSAAVHADPVYGREPLLRALMRLRRRHPRVGLAAFGRGAEAQVLGAIARGAGLEAHVEPLGELSHDATLEVIAASDAFVRPTIADGDSLSVREALALGVPCVASDVCARPPGVILFRAGDDHALAQAIEDALSRPRERVETSGSGEALYALYAERSPRLSGRRGVFKNEEKPHAREYGDNLGGRGVAGPRLDRLLQRLGWRPALEGAHHAHLGASQPGAVDQQHRQPGSAREPA